MYFSYFHQNKFRLDKKNPEQALGFYTLTYS